MARTSSSAITILFAIACVPGLLGATGCAHHRRDSALAWHARFNRLPEARRREYLHDSLRRFREPHDTYVHLISIGDETSVPFLLDRFKTDYGAVTPPPPPTRRVLIPSPPDFPELPPIYDAASNAGLIPAYPCVWGHLVENLQNITNTDRGMYFRPWQEWWEANRNRPRRTWVLDGFAAVGLHPTDPIDERFGLELIGSLVDPRDYRALNARRLLAEIPLSTRMAWIDRAAASDRSEQRRGATAALARFAPTGHEDLLRTLTADTNEDVARDALTELNVRLRARLTAAERNRPHRGSGIWKLRGASKHADIDDVAWAGPLVIVRTRHRQIVAYDPRWSRPVAGPRTSEYERPAVQIQADTMYVRSERELRALRLADGAPLWCEREDRGWSWPIPTIAGLLLHEDGRAELRDARSGEVIRMWPGIEGVRKMAVREHLAALAGIHGEVWLVELSAPASPSPAAR